ncbi:MAG: ABC transporter permease [Kineosporiaceae bacterium]
MRTAVMILALALGVLAVTAVLTARAVLSTAVTQGYLEGVPASATLVVHAGVTPADVAAVRPLPGVADAARRGSATGTLTTPGGVSVGVRYFVADPGDALTVSSVSPRSAWPPAEGEVLMERSSLAVVHARPGDRVRLSAAGHPAQAFTVAASVRDGALAPSSQEQTAYVYLTARAAQRLGAPAQERLLLRVDGDDGRPTGDRARIRAVAEAAAAALEERGRPVERIELPPPLRHPHEAQMRTVGLVLVLFAASALALSSLLVAVVLGGAVAAQTPRIGALKSIGATDRQVLAVYLAQAAAIAASATAVALPAGVALGRALAARAASMMNLDVGAVPVPAAVLAACAACGLVVPVLAAWVPLRRASRITPREAMDAVGGRAGALRDRRAPRLPGVLAGTRPLGLALASLLRNPARVALGAGMLALAGALVLTGVDTAQGWRVLVDEAMARRHYDLQVTLSTSMPASSLRALAEGVEGVAAAEAWGSLPLTMPAGDGPPVTATYPDQSHAGFTLLAPPHGSSLLTLPLVAGRRPDPTDPADSDAVLVNQLVPGSQVPGLHVGDVVELLAAGRPLRLHVVGIVSDFGTHAAVYASPEVYALASGQGGSDPAVSTLRVVTDEHDPAARRVTLARLEAALAGEGADVDQGFPVDTLKAALDGHVLVLADALIVIGLLMGLVGLLGLASSLSTSVAERTWEFGVLHALGARRSRVAWQVVLEGGATAGAGVLLAAVLAAPLTALTGRVMGEQAFRQTLPWQYSVAALSLWLVLTLAGSAAAAAGAAARASRMTVRDALSSL